MGTCEQQTTSKHSRPLDDLVAELLISDIPSQAHQAASKFCRETSKPKLGKGTAWNLLRQKTTGTTSSALVSQKSSWTLIEPNYAPYPRSAREHAAVHTLHLEGPLPSPMLLVHAGKHTYTPVYTFLIASQHPLKQGIYPAELKS